MKIVISNIYGKFNLGDQAIRNSGVKLISEIYPRSDAVLLCEDIDDFRLNRKIPLKLHEQFAPYGYVIRPVDKQAASKLVKFIRFSWVIFFSFILFLLGTVSNSLLTQKGFFSYIYHIKTADVFFLMGGGYLVTRNHINDTLGLVLNVLPLLIAKFYKKRTVVLPISYGPYFNSFHKSLADSSMKEAKVTCRDQISLQLAKAAQPSAKFFPDLALYEWDTFSRKQIKNYFVLTVKNYYSLDKQIPIEKEFAKFVNYIWDTYQLGCVFIPTGANPIEENDIPSGERISQDVEGGVFKMIIPKTPEETIKVISHAKFSVCTRMHSAIFSALAYTPFISIAYEHKVTGFMQLMDLEEWNTGMIDLKFDTLKNLADSIIQNDTQKKYLQHLKNKREAILLERNQLKEYIVKE